MARCAGCGAEIPTGIFAYEGDDGNPLCRRCFGVSEAGGGRRPARGFPLLRALSVAFRVFAAAGLAGGAVIARLAPPGDRFAAAAGLVLGAGVFIACLALAEVMRLGLSLEASLDRLSREVERMGGGSHGG